MTVYLPGNYLSPVIISLQDHSECQRCKETFIPCYQEIIFHITWIMSGGHVLIELKIKKNIIKAGVTDSTPGTLQVNR